MPPSSENSHSSRTTPPSTPSSGSDVNLALENLALENVHPEFNNVERQRLLAATDHATGGVVVDPVTWVMLWLGDTKLVKNKLLRIQEYHQKKFSQDREELLGTLQWALRSAIVYPFHAFAYVQREIEMGLHNDSQLGLCRVRDSSRCIVTNTPGITHVAHVFPYYLHGPMATSRDDGRASYEEPNIVAGQFFWMDCSGYWSKDRIATMQRSLESTETATICQNLLTMSPTARMYWDYGAFALKPIKNSQKDTEKGRVLQLEFHWLPQTTERPRRHRLNEVPTLEVTTEEEIIKGLAAEMVACEQEIRKAVKQPTHVERLLGQDGETIKSGTIITMKTDDPVKMPLPDVELLELQWHMSRLFALRGRCMAGEPDLCDKEDAKHHYPYFPGRWHMGRIGNRDWPSLVAGPREEGDDYSDEFDSNGV